ncbi:DUF6318 family protein [Blastococcus sp. PRF04-17]|uniref:DUF6318 family protein n=1 Tax=Blastococcus sp. PRF04-17 TaxID=2933797 RepID=UPI001FF6D832|nr:DUF6318 family protein [Blastococcus sp. PRF04-17]UOY01164.1 DUF6318 family protein [Blastococcus sp. PRF04-17]
MNRLVALLAAGLVVLVGCSQKQEANTTLPPTSAAETTEALPSRGPADMPMPDEARMRDAAGAEAFVRYYIELINRTSTVMDAEPLRDFSDGCRECNRIADDTDEDAAAGYSYRGGELTITYIEARESDPTSVSFTADQAAMTVVDRSGQPVEGLVFDALPRLSSGATLRWDEPMQSWIMVGLTLG